LCQVTLVSIGCVTDIAIQRVSNVKALAQIEFILSWRFSVCFFGEHSSKVEGLGMVLVAIGILELVIFTK